MFNDNLRRWWWWWRSWSLYKRILNIHTKKTCVLTLDLKILAFLMMTVDGGGGGGGGGVIRRL